MTTQWISPHRCLSGHPVPSSVRPRVAAAQSVWMTFHFHPRNSEGNDWSLFSTKKKKKKIGRPFHCPFNQTQTESTYAHGSSAAQRDVWHCSRLPRTGGTAQCGSGTAVISAHVSPASKIGPHDTVSDEKAKPYPRIVIENGTEKGRDDEQQHDGPPPARKQGIQKDRRHGNQQQHHHHKHCKNIQYQINKKIFPREPLCDPRRPSNPASAKDCYAECQSCTELSTELRDFNCCSRNAKERLAFTELH